MPGKPILISVPVGNNPARVRLVMYLKGLEAEIEIKSPTDYGGLSSPEYRKMNPQGKIPVLILEDGSSLFEARIISSYICDRWERQGASLRAASPEKRALAALIHQVHDLYIASANSSHPSVTANQGCMYKPVEVIDAPSRAIKVAELWKQLEVLEGLVVGPYCVGEEITEADCALYPTFQFFLFMLPRVFGWPSVVDKFPKLKAWLEAMDAVPAAQRVKSEILPNLEDWEASGRFAPIVKQVKAAASLKWTFP